MIMYKLGDVVTIEPHEGTEYSGKKGILVEKKELTYWFVQFSKRKGDIKGFPESMFIKANNQIHLEHKNDNFIEMVLNNQNVYVNIKEIGILDFDLISSEWEYS